MESVALLALSPIDTCRAAVLRLVGPVVQPFLRDRALRVGVYGVASVAVALAFAALAPLALLTLGPIVLGVPHIASDIRYLVVRQGFHRRTALWIFVAPFLVATVFEPRFGWGLCAVAAAALVARGSRVLRATACAVCVALWVLSRGLGSSADILFAHAHNLVAGGFWIAWARGNRRHVLPGALLFAAGAALIFTGSFEPLLFRSHGLTPTWYAIGAGALVSSLSPVSDPIWALRCVVFFAFAQSVHYGIWIRIVPEEDRARRGVRSFSSSYRALVADLGSVLVLAFFAGSVALWIYAGFDVLAARAAYLRIALFHGPLEIATALLLAIERRGLTCAG